MRLPAAVYAASNSLARVVLDLSVNRGHAGVVDLMCCRCTNQTQRAARAHLHSDPLSQFARLVAVQLRSLIQSSFRCICHARISRTGSDSKSEARTRMSTRSCVTALQRCDASSNSENRRIAGSAPSFTEHASVRMGLPGVSEITSRTR